MLLGHYKPLKYYYVTPFLAQQAIIIVFYCYYSFTSSFGNSFVMSQAQELKILLFSHIFSIVLLSSSLGSQDAIIIILFSLRDSSTPRLANEVNNTNNLRIIFYLYFIIHFLFLKCYLLSRHFRRIKCYIIFIFYLYFIVAFI